MTSSPARKRLGLIGGLDAASPISYWREISREAAFHLGPGSSIDLLMSSGATGLLATLFRAGDWNALAHRLGGEALRLAAAGAEGLVMCDPALNPIAAEIGRTAGIPCISVAAAIAEIFRPARLRRSAILGIRSAAEEQMWRDALPGVALVQPIMAERIWLDGCLESPLPSESPPEQWKGETTLMLANLKQAGAQSVILSHPSLVHYVSLSDAPLPVFNALEIHAGAAAAWALGLDRAARRRDDAVHRSS